MLRGSPLNVDIPPADQVLSRSQPTKIEIPSEDLIRAVHADTKPRDSRLSYGYRVEPKVP